MHMGFRKALATILTGFHYAPLSSFILFSTLQSTRCLLLLCSPCGPRLRSGARWHISTLIRLRLMPHLAPPLCAHAPWRSLHCPPQPGALAGNSVVTSSIAFEGERLCDSVGKCATRPRFFLAAGAITLQDNPSNHIYTWLVAAVFESY